MLQVKLGGGKPSEYSGNDGESLNVQLGEILTRPLAEYLFEEVKVIGDLLIYKAKTPRPCSAAGSRP